MSWQLVDFVGPIINPLRDAHSQLDQFTSLHRDAQNALQAMGTNLTNASGLDLFVGAGAGAFSEAIAQYMSGSAWHMQVLDQAASATMACANAVWEAAAVAAGASLDEGLVSEVLSRLTHDDVIRSGGNSVVAIINDMKKTLGNMASSGGDFFGHLIHGDIGGALHDAGREFSDAGHLVGDVMGLLDDIAGVLFHWAERIYETVKGWIEAIVSFVQALFLYKPHITKGTPTQLQMSADRAFNQKPNMLTLYREIDAQEATSNKIGIEQLGPNTLLVTLAGTDTNHSAWSTNLADALDAGAGDKNNPYLRDIEAAIEQYIKENHLPPGTQIIVAGHSLGGIEAEYLAENNGKTNYTVKDVITYGSPQIGPPVSGVQYDQYFNRYDPITLTSWYELGPIVRAVGIPGALLAAYNLDTGPVQNKASFIQETPVPGNYNKFPSNPSLYNLASMQDHQYTNDTWLQNQPIPLGHTTLGSINGSGTSGQTQFYVGTPQNQSADWTRFSLQAILDLRTPSLPGIQPISSPW